MRQAIPSRVDQNNGPWFVSIRAIVWEKCIGKGEHSRSAKTLYELCDDQEGNGLDESGYKSSWELGKHLLETPVHIMPKPMIVASFRPCVSEARLITTSPAIAPIENIDWIRLRAHSLPQYSSIDDVNVNGAPMYNKMVTHLTLLDHRTGFRL